MSHLCKYYLAFTLNGLELQFTIYNVDGILGFYHLNELGI